MNAAILSIGSEIVQGFLTDTNSTQLAREINLVGVEVVGVFQVGDNLERLQLALRRAMEDADLVVCTGGIGPTADDLTREAVAAICGERPEIDPETLETVRAFFRRRGAEMPERNAKQAWTIPSAEILPNPAGTAPGWFVRHAGKIIVLMPGVPREMEPMWQEQALPRLFEYLPSTSIEVDTLKTIGLGESAVEQLLHGLVERGYPIVSTYAKNDGVHVRMVAVSDNQEESLSAVHSTRAEIESILGDHVYGDLNVSLPRAVLQPISERGKSIAIWEAGTRGQVASLMLSDDSVADVVRDARVAGNNAAGTPGQDVVDPIERARLGVSALDAVDDLVRLGVAVVLGDPDSMGRYDARVGIVVQSDEEEVTDEFKLAAAPAEIGRRASLLAAEILRRVSMAASSRPSW